MSPKRVGFEHLLDAVPDALVGMDQEGVIRFVNRQTESLFGYDRDRLIGQPIETLVPETLRQIYTEHQQGYFADPRTRSAGVELELSGRQRDGTEFPISVSLSHIETGDVLLVITATGDVAQRTEAVQAARHTEAMVEYSDDAIIGLTPDGTITSWNPAAERMYGYSSEEIVGRAGSLLTPGDRPGELTAILARIKDGEYVDHSETTLVRKDGTVVPVSVAAAPIRDQDGAIVGVSAVHRNVTERRQAFENAQRMAAIVEYSDDAIISRSLDGKITSWNPAAERMYGYTSAEMIGRPDTILTLRDRAREVEAVLDRIKAGRPVDRLETKRVRKDGTVFPVSLTISALRDPDGEVVGTSVIHRDLTEQKKAFAAVRRMASIIEFSQDAIISGTLDGIITSWNPAAERMFGYNSDEMVGKSLDLTIPRDRASEARDVVAWASAGEAVEELETVRVRKDGTAFPVALTVSPVRDDDGAVVGASMICRDVTELKRAAQYARGLIEADPDPLGMISPDGTITDVNEATVKVTGVPRDELIGTEFAQYFADPDTARKGVAWAFEHGSLTDGLLTARHRDGTLRDFLCNATVYRDLNGEVLGVLTSARDVTRQRQAQRESAQQQARERDRLKELEQFRQLTLGRELKMIELKKEIEYLRQFGPEDGEFGPAD